MKKHSDLRAALTEHSCAANVTDSDAVLQDGEYAMLGAPHALGPPRHAVVAPARSSGQDVRKVTTAEVENLEAEGALTVCRTFQSFSYGARLFFHRADLVFYVTLHHDGALWRVLKITELDSAEVAFGHFTQQATQLSEEEMRRTMLQAKNDELVRLIEQAQEQVERLRTDLDSHAAQAQLVSQRAQRTRQEIGQLEAQRIAAQTQLSRLRRQIQQLDLVGNERFPRQLTRQIRTAASSD